MRFKVLTLVVVAALAVAAWRLWPGEERRVKARLAALAAELSIPPGEAGLSRVARAARVRHFFTSDVAVEVVNGQGLTIRGPEEIAGYVARLSVPPEGTRVELLDLETELSADRLAADARVKTRVVSRAAGDRASSVLDARMIALTLRKIEGDWRIASARVMPTDDALGLR